MLLSDATSEPRSLSLLDYCTHLATKIGIKALQSCINVFASEEVQTSIANSLGVKGFMHKLHNFSEGAIKKGTLIELEQWNTSRTLLEFITSEAPKELVTIKPPPALKAITPTGNEVLCLEMSREEVQLMDDEGQDMTTSVIDVNGGYYGLSDLARATHYELDTDNVGDGQDEVEPVSFVKDFTLFTEISPNDEGGWTLDGVVETFSYPDHPDYVEAF